MNAIAWYRPSPEDEEEVLRLITNDPKLSVGPIAVQLQMSRWHVWRILKEKDYILIVFDGFTM